MKVSLNWLSDYVDVSSMPAKELAGVFLRIGFPVEEVIETDTDIVLDLEVTSNRPDLLGHIGVARELAAATGRAFTPPKIGKLPTAPAGTLGNPFAFWQKMWLDAATPAAPQAWPAPADTPVAEQLWQPVAAAYRTANGHAMAAVLRTMADVVEPKPQGFSPPSYWPGTFGTRH